MSTLRFAVALFALASALCACTVQSTPTATGVLPHVAKPMDNGQIDPPLIHKAIQALHDARSRAGAASLL